MADRIQLLPDHIANQIAAGEVIQRPASAVKELLENAVDAGASSIKLIINDGGKSLIQVIDNGAGMSETDARMCFERHATSKIKNIDDLFHIRTMGFRGEALASIAAVAQVELITKREQDEVGISIEIENSMVTKQQPVAAPTGTSIAMKNLFFNVPARRNFLKSNASEMRHVVDEFTRVALAFPNIFFSLTNNDHELFHLEEGSLKLRILQLLGNHYNSKLVSLKEETDYLNIYGFAGKPETAKRTRGDQYFFVNNRFIKSAYLNHAVMNAYQDMISPDSFPAYALFIELDPAVVDVNVHPTKQEIKFEDEKIVYAFIQAAIKHALAQFSITPTLDFDLDASIQSLDAIQKPFTEEKQSATRLSSIFQTFTEANQAHKFELGKDGDLKHWKEYKPSTLLNQTDKEESAFSLPKVPEDLLHSQNLLQSEFSNAKPVQLFNTYILITITNSIVLIHQQSAHERIIYEQLVEALNGKAIATQQSLFPATIELNSQDAALLTELLPELQQMGYSIEPFGKHTFLIQGTPADLKVGNEKRVVEKIIEQYKNFTPELKLSNREMLIRSVCWQQALKTGTPLSEKEMQGLIGDLFKCKQPNSTPNGKPTYTDFKRESLEKIFGR